MTYPPGSDSQTVEALLTAGESSHAAIVDSHGGGLTYGELRGLVSETHGFLRQHGIAPSDTVAYSLRNGPETASLFIALATYCRVAPLNPHYTADEVAFSLRDFGAAALIVSPDLQPSIEASSCCGIGYISLLKGSGPSPGRFTLKTSMPTNPLTSEDKAPGSDDVALLLHTSGTTSRPKLVPLTQRNLWISSQSVKNVLELVPGDRCLSLMPLFHIHGLVAGLLASIGAGATVCCEVFQATGFFSALQSSEATWYTGVPTMHQAILARARHNQSVLSNHKLRFIRSSSAPLFSNVWDQLESAFRVPVLNAYGMTEAAHQICSVRLPGGSRFRNTVGPSVGPDIAIMDASGTFLARGLRGEVALCGNQIMSGYLQPSGANQAAFTDGWFRTGDEGIIDDQGVLTLTGRLKELINSGGEKISPYEVEEVLLQHPAVSQAVAFGAPHELLGEEVAAAVILKEGFQLTARDLLDAAAHRLARHKLPRRLLFLDEIPCGPTGKPQRIGLASRLGL